MKRHHIVGIIAGICAIGLAVRSALSANIIDAVISFTVLSGVAISTFFQGDLVFHWMALKVPLIRGI